MLSFEQALAGHIDNITKALECNSVENVLKAVYEFGSMLQIQHPDKDYMAMQKFLESYQAGYANHSLSDKAIIQTGALFQMISDYYYYHAFQDQERRREGDLSMFMTNNALKAGVLCFSCLMPNHEVRLKQVAPPSVKDLVGLQSAKVDKWIDKTISKANSSKKYDLKYLDQLCAVMEEQLSKKIRLVSGVSAEKSKELQKIIQSQNDTVKKLRQLLKDPARLPHEQLSDFMQVYNEDATQELLDKTKLGKNFKEQISSLLNILSKEGFFSAYSMWKQHKALQEIDEKVRAVKEPPPKPSN